MGVIRASINPRGLPVRHALHRRFSKRPLTGKSNVASDSPARSISRKMPGSTLRLSGGLRSKVYVKDMDNLRLVMTI